MTDAPVCPHGEHPSVCLDCMFENPPPARARGSHFVPPKGALTSEKVSEITEVPYAQLLRWVANGIVVPSVHLAVGSGDTHYYSESDVRLVSALKALAKLHCFLENLGPFSRWWADTDPPVGSHVAVVPDGGAVVINPGSGLADIANLGPCWLIPVD